MYKLYHICVVVEFVINCHGNLVSANDVNKIELIDLTRMTNWEDLYEYYEAIEKRRKICVNCGIPGLGTTMHLEHSPTVSSMRPALIPSEYLVTRMLMIDVSSHVVHNPSYVLSLSSALRWPALQRDPREPTLLVFRFGWVATGAHKAWSCVCITPGISYELAQWIASNLTHVIGVATDAPTLESEQTREFTTRTVSNLLGKNGVYMIVNANVGDKITQRGCMAFAMPMKLLAYNLVPTRLVAFCPTMKTDKAVVVALRRNHHDQATKSRLFDVNMDDLMPFKMES